MKVQVVKLVMLKFHTKILRRWNTLIARGRGARVLGLLSHKSGRRQSVQVLDNVIDQVENTVDEGTGVVAKKILIKSTWDSVQSRLQQGLQDLSIGIGH